ncbi:hypothetical protein I6A84_33775 [Frankia sp. CNm7]|uniref:Uncharacterized protein n=1 Tax=Frankia nepalensis TaxID=1836974 RepID=A0A937RKV8_9ACTN|nr:protealysin inhibitor emfourin [Frankia nepalensis]MBL7497424.1 hypothetical protein [Frankia nepalensis]MBL7512740.1 hypothetical protein [Frankia nepalensis]MBL7522924.1 hypothetical protein [Frankia nepalensis]MBL7632157.1 hypothetical protein [Frankia nepalensis]
MSDRERVRVVLERSGGFAGRTIRRGLDTDDLPDAEAEALRALVGALPAAPAHAAGPAKAAGPDRFTYAVAVDAAGHQGVHHFADPLPEAAKSLIQLLSKAPLLPAHG